MADTAFLNFIPGETVWFPIVHASHNAFLYWRMDTWFSFLPVKSILLIYLGILATGLFAIFQHKSSQDPLRNLLLAITCPILLLYLFNFDTVLLSSISWIPWLSYMMIRFSTAQKNHLLWGFILLLVTARMVKASNYLAVIPLISSLLVAHSISKFNRRSFITVLILTGVPTIYANARLLLPVFPSYPGLSRVVPDDGVAGYLTPFFGIMFPIPVIDRSFIRATFLTPALIFSIFFIISYLRTEKRSFLLGSSVLLAIFFLLDTGFIPEEFSQIAPLSTLTRVVPGLMLSPLACFSCAILLIFAFVVYQKDLKTLIALCLLLTFVTYNDSTFDLGLKNGKYINNKLPKDIGSDLRDYVVSPSLHIIEERGTHILDKNFQAKKYKRISPNKIGATLNSSHNEDLLSLVEDDDFKTRWSNTAGGQDGSEWIHLKLKEPTPILGLALPVGDFSSDFPRGIEVDYLRDCTEVDTAKFENYNQALAYKSWQGPTRYTKEGYPYYGYQSVVKLPFNSEITAQCILVKQIGHDRSFDWSIAELQLLVNR
ncbi:MAG: hypothetical protein H6619_02770 [Deltaproteobacteria bacterium]|nr:hypothetical protein [Deltaproteobacteria bacterium]